MLFNSQATAVPGISDMGLLSILLGVKRTKKEIKEMKRKWADKISDDAIAIHKRD